MRLISFLYPLIFIKSFFYPLELLFYKKYKETIIFNIVIGKSKVGKIIFNKKYIYVSLTKINYMKLKFSPNNLYLEYRFQESYIYIYSLKNKLILKLQCNRNNFDIIIFSCPTVVCQEGVTTNDN